MEEPMNVPRRLITTRRLAAALALAGGLSVPACAADRPEDVGQWGDLLPMQNVPIHTHVLPDGRVLYWSRREAEDKDNLHPPDCKPRIWDPKEKDQAKATKLTANTPGFNLFCSGHTFLAD